MAQKIGTKRVTLSDVSRRAKVSVNTAAKVLADQAGEARISDKTARKVRKAAKEIGYVPNLMARNLRSKRTGTIGVFVADMTDSVYALTSQLILKQLHAKGFSPLLTVAEIGQQLCKQEWIQNRIEGLILCGTTDYMTANFFEELKEMGINTLIAGCTFRNPDKTKAREAQISTVSVDNYAGIEKAINHLFENNKKRIAYLCGPDWHGDSWERRMAYDNIVSQYHKPIVVSQERDGRFWKMGYESMGHLNSLGIEYDAIIAYDDQFAIGATKWLVEHKQNIPEQVALIGFDNSPESESCTPALTTIAQPLEAIASKSVSLIEQSLVRSIPVEKVQIVPSLVVRQSTFNDRQKNL